MVFMAENLKRPLWIAPGEVSNGIRQFDTPVLYNWGWRTMSSSADIMAFGPKYMDYRKAAVDNAQIDNIKRFDRVWMDVTPSDLTDTLGSDADFYILSAVPGAGGIALVTFKRLSSDA